MKSNIIRSSLLATLTAVAALPVSAQQPLQYPQGTPVGLPVYVPLQNSLPIRPEVAARLRPVNTTAPAFRVSEADTRTQPPAESATQPKSPTVTKVSRAIYLTPADADSKSSDGQQMTLKPPTTGATGTVEPRMAAATETASVDQNTVKPNTVKPVVGLSTPWAATDRQVVLASGTEVTSTIPTVQRTVFFQDPISVPEPGTFATPPAGLPSGGGQPAPGGSMALPPGLGGGAPSAPAVGLPPAGAGGSAGPGTALPPASMMDGLPSGGGATGSLGGPSTTTLPAPTTAEPLPSQPLPSQTFPSQPLPTQTFPPTTDYSQIEQPSISPHANMDNCRLITGPSPHPSTNTFYGVCQPVVPSSCTTPVAPPPRTYSAPVQVLPPSTPLVTQPGQVQAPARALVSFGQERNVVQVGQGLWGQPVAYVPGQGVRNWIRYMFP